MVLVKKIKNYRLGLNLKENRTFYNQNFVWWKIRFIVYKIDVFSLILKFLLLEYFIMKEKKFIFKLIFFSNYRAGISVFFVKFKIQALPL